MRLHCDVIDCFLNLSLSSSLFLTRLHDRLTGSMVSDLYHRLRRSRREGAPPEEAAEESMLLMKKWNWRRAFFDKTEEEESESIEPGEKEKTSRVSRLEALEERAGNCCCSCPSLSLSLLGTYSLLLSLFLSLRICGAALRASTAEEVLEDTTTTTTTMAIDHPNSVDRERRRSSSPSRASATTTASRWPCSRRWPSWQAPRTRPCSGCCW